MAPSVPENLIKLTERQLSFGLITGYLLIQLKTLTLVFLTFNNLQSIHVIFLMVTSINFAFLVLSTCTAVEFIILKMNVEKRNVF